MTNTPGHIELERSIESIRIGSRHRTDLGDLDALAASIQKQGLLQPITVTPDGTLVCGARRLAALRQLGVRKLNVWVRSGISDRLTQLLAEQDDNALHKTLSPTEAASLYREVKVLLAEDARRRQEASRFSATGSNGAATVAAPLTSLDGYARSQAAVLVTGRQSYTTLERISYLQHIAADETLDETLHKQAAVELESIESGGSVKAAHERISTQIAFAELQRLATHDAQPELVASLAIARMQGAEGAETGTDLEQLAREALARVKAATKGKNSRPSLAADTKLPARSFVFLWKDLQDWWVRYDCAAIACELTDEQWDQFDATLAGTIAFAERMRALRPDTLVGADHSATISQIR